MLPTVSVLIPVFNGARTLGRALESTLSQSLSDLEAVVVLNGCTDESEEVCRKYAQSDNRVRTEVLSTRGIVTALNHGLQVTRSGLVARLDADDVMYPERLARQTDALTAQPDWCLVACGVRHVPAQERSPGLGMERHVAWINSLLTPEQIRASRFIDAPVAHPSVMFRRDVVVQAGGYRDGSFPEDYELWLRLLHSGERIGRVPEVLVDWFDHGDRLTRTDCRYSQEAHRTLKHRYLLAGPLRHARHARIWGAGPFGKRHARDLVAAGACIDDMIDIDPRKIGRRVAGGLPVVDASSLGSPDGRLILLAVGSEGARELIEHALSERGYLPERDYLALQ